MVLFREELLPLVEQRILSVSGSSKIDQPLLVGKKIHTIKVWGKHMLWCFDGFTLRIHFLMFGTYYLNAEKDRVPKLFIRFEKDYLNLYACAIRLLQEPLDKLYDWTADVLSDHWNAKAALQKLKAIPETTVTDALLDQTIFSGVGNIIKNEILHLVKVHPLSPIGAIPPRKLTELATQASAYSHRFLAWKREGVLRQHWAVHGKKICLRDGAQICKDHLGQTDRRTFYCPTCQVKY